MIKNPPEKKIDDHGESLTKKKDRKKGDTKEGKNSDDDDKVEAGNDDDDDDWAPEDVSEEAVKARMEALSGGLGGLVIDNDMEKPENERINIFHKFVKNKIQSGLGLNAAVQKEIVGEAERLEVKNKAPIVLCELLFDEKMVKDKQIKKNKALLLRFCHDNQKAQKYLTGGLEKTIETYEATLLPKVVHIFKEGFEEVCFQRDSFQDTREGCSLRQMAQRGRGGKR